MMGADLGAETMVPSEPMEVLSGLERSGLVPGEIRGEVAGEVGLARSLGGRGDRGTFHRLASSGRSSSTSSHSASSSLIDFLLGCHDPLLTGICGIVAGVGPSRRGDLGLGKALGGDCVGEMGEGDRDLL